MNSKSFIYMDNHATTPVDPRVVEAMAPYWTESFGNASSPHYALGQKASEVVEQGRISLAKLISCQADEIYFTSGATESNNIAIQGIASLHKDSGKHIVTSAIEHPSVLEVCTALEENGFQITIVPVDDMGLVNVKALEEAIRSDTILISIMMANNEIGVTQPIKVISKIAKKHHIPFHVDAAQAVGKISVNVMEQGIDVMSFSAHKMYGPKGIGALYVRKENPRIRIKPLMFGGGQEQALRPGTLNVPGIVGFGKAAEICLNEMDAEGKRIGALRDKLLKGIQDQLDGVHVNGCMKYRLPHNLNLSFSYVEGESLLKSLNHIALSSSSACSSSSIQVSYVLKALKLKEELIHTALRFGLGRFNAEEEVDEVIETIVKTVKHLRSLSTMYQMKQSEKGTNSDITLARKPGEAIEPN